jgi:uncharacterized protein (TIGR00369 family)
MDLNKPLERILAQRIPFQDLLGIEVEHIEVGGALMRIPARPDLTGDPFRPALHGGVISALADSAGGLAVFTQLDEDQVTSTVDIRVDYLRPGNVDEDLLAKSTVVRMGSRVATTHTVIYQSNPDKPVAVSSAVYSVVRLKRPQSDTEAASTD